MIWSVSGNHISKASISVKSNSTRQLSSITFITRACSPASHTLSTDVLPAYCTPEAISLGSCSVLLSHFRSPLHIQAMPHTHIYTVHCPPLCSVSLFNYAISCVSSQQHPIPKGVCSDSMVFSGCCTRDSLNILSFCATCMCSYRLCLRAQLEHVLRS